MVINNENLTFSPKTYFSTKKTAPAPDSLVNFSKLLYQVTNQTLVRLLKKKLGPFKSAPYLGDIVEHRAPPLTPPPSLELILKLKNLKFTKSFQLIAYLVDLLSQIDKYSKSVKKNCWFSFLDFLDNLHHVLVIQFMLLADSLKLN